MIDEQKLKEIMMTLGIGKNDVARDYSQEPIRFLVDKESVELHFDGHSGCCYVNNDVNRQMWFSQFNGIYISFEEHFKKIENVFLNILHSHQQCIRDLIPPHSCPFW